MRILILWLGVLSSILSLFLFSFGNHEILHVKEFEELNRLGIGHVNDLEFHPDNHTLAVGTDTGIYLYSVPELVQTSNFDFYAKPVEDIAWSPDGKWLGYTSAGDIYLWNRVSDKTTLLTENLFGSRLDWSPDGTQLAAIGIPSSANINSNTPRLWSKLYRWKISGKNFQSYGSVTVQAAHQGFYRFYWTEGYMIAYSGWNENQVTAWTINNPQQIIPLGGYVPSATLSTSPNKDYLILYPYYQNDAKEIIHRLDTKTLQWEDIPIIHDVFGDIILWRQNDLIAFVFNNGVDVSIFDTQIWAIEQNFQLAYSIGTWSSFAMSPDEKYIATLSNGQLILIDLATWQITQAVPTHWQKHNNILPMALSPDGKYLASLQHTPEGNNRIHFIDIQSGAGITDIPTPLENINMLVFSPHHDYLAAIYDLNKLAIIDVQNQQTLILHWSFGRKISDIVWSENDILVVAEGIIQRLRINENDLPNIQLIARESLISPSSVTNVFKIFAYEDNVFAQKINSFIAYIQKDALKWSIDSVQTTKNALSSDGKFLVTQSFTTQHSRSIQIRNIETGIVVDERPFSNQPITAIAWHPDYLAITTNPINSNLSSYIQLWLIDSQGKFLQDVPWHTFEAHHATRVGCCGSSSEITHLWWEGDQLYSIGVDGTVRTWGIPD